MMNQPKVFISYAHKDAEWLERLETHLKPLERRGLIKLWHDKRIESGLNWRQEIEDALATSDVAILLISANYLASDFIDAKELPTILSAAKAKGTRILPVIVSPYLVEHIKALKEIQAVNPPDKPLSTMNVDEREALFVRVAKAIVDIAASANEPKLPEASIDSENLPDNFTKLPKHGVLPRWKHLVLPGLAVMALSLICGIVLAKLLFSFKERDVVIMVGSGTVLQYLTVSGFFDQVKDKELNVQILRGPTKTGATLFANAFDQDSMTVLAMAAESLSSNELRRSKEKPRAVFQAYLGEDPLQVLLIAPDGTANDTAALNAVFPFSAKGREIDFATLANALATRKFELYVGSLGAATLDQWKTPLVAKNKAAWPAKPGFWDIQNPGGINEHSAEPRIYLGSKVLIDMEIGRKIHRPYRVLDMVENSQPISRGLYLYGFLDTSDNKIKMRGQEPGYNLSKPVTKILQNVFGSKQVPGSKLALLNEKCLQLQREYFNLDADPGWVSKYSDKDGIYQAKPCPGQTE